MLGAGACASPSGEQAASSNEDVVEQTTFDRASAIVNGVDYLPFQYKIDGCYARALYMSMELAAKGYESNALFAFARDGSVLQVGDVQWGYHVAPMLEVRSSQGTITNMVIDPALAARPLSQATWLADMGYAPTTPPDKMPSTLIVPGSDYAPQEALDDREHINQDTPDFSHLPPFKTSDIQSACGVMYQYLSREPGAAPDAVHTKQEKLIQRTTALVAALRGATKLTEDTTFSADDCRTAPAPF